MGREEGEADGGWRMADGPPEAGKLDWRMADGPPEAGKLDWRMADGPPEAGKLGGWSQDMGNASGSGHG